jgi:pectate lyase
MRLISRLPLLCGIALATPQLAFPEAEGFGRFAQGGRQGSSYVVHSLADSGPGSLRDALSQPGRIITFNISGVIKIGKRLVVPNSTTLLGQTAPGSGITVYGNGWSFSNADESIIRHIRIRMGAAGDKGKDAMTLAHGKNILFDHISASWGRDETFSINGTEAVLIYNRILT